VAFFFFFQQGPASRPTPPLWLATTIPPRRARPPLPRSSNPRAISTSLSRATVFFYFFLLPDRLLARGDRSPLPKQHVEIRWAPFPSFFWQLPIRSQGGRGPFSFQYAGRASPLPQGSPPSSKLFFFAPCRPPAPFSFRRWHRLCSNSPRSSYDIGLFPQGLRALFFYARRREIFPASRGDFAILAGFPLFFASLNLLKQSPQQLRKRSQGPGRLAAFFSRRLKEKSFLFGEVMLFFF